MTVACPRLTALQTTLSPNSSIMFPASLLEQSMDLQRLLRSGLMVQLVLQDGSGGSGADQVAEHISVQVEQIQVPEGRPQYRLVGFNVRAAADTWPQGPLISPRAARGISCCLTPGPVL